MRNPATPAACDSSASHPSSKRAKRPDKNAPRITLGDGWKRFTRPQAQMTLLGVIQRGLEIGALARTPDGQYIQLNGDMVQTLNASRIEAALRSARPAKPSGWSMASSGPDRTAGGATAAPKVSIRPRRRITGPVSSSE